jgi:hypothetical protein
VIDIAADTTDVFEESLVRSALLILDVALFLVEALLRAVVPVVWKSAELVAQRLMEALMVQEWGYNMVLTLSADRNEDAWRPLEHFADNNDE